MFGLGIGLGLKFFNSSFTVSPCSAIDRPHKLLKPCITYMSTCTIRNAKQMLLVVSSIPPAQPVILTVILRTYTKLILNLTQTLKPTLALSVILTKTYPKCRPNIRYSYGRNCKISPAGILICDPGLGISWIRLGIGLALWLRLGLWVGLRIKLGLQVPSSNAGQGSQCHPIGLGRHVGPSAIPRRFPAIILGTESHGGNSKITTTPNHTTTLYTMGFTKGFHSPHRKPPGKWPNPTADQPHEQCSHAPPPCPRAIWGKRELPKGF